MPASLYDRLGGGPAVEAATKALYDRLLADPLLAWAFDGVDMDRQAARMAAFLAQATGGPATYTGPSLDKVHARLNLTDREVDVVIGQLGAVLGGLGAGVAEVGQAAALVGSARAHVIGAPPAPPGWPFRPRPSGRPLVAARLSRRATKGGDPFRRPVGAAV